MPGQAVIRKETPALQGLAKVNRHLVHEVARHAGVTEATIDVDASIHECRKKTALHCYEGPQRRLSFGLRGSRRCL